MSKELYPTMMDDPEYQKLVESAKFIAEFFKLRGVENWEFMEIKCRWKTEPEIYIKEIQ